VANRIDQKFSELTSAGKKGLFPFLVAGQPDLETTKQITIRLEKLGVSGIELGFPFTDPVADGPVIQSAFTHALETGTTVAKIMKAISEIRDQVSIPILAMVSASIVYRIGVDKFIEQAAKAGFDGFIIPDLSLEEAPAIAEKVAALDLRLAMLVSPASTAERQEKIVKTAKGFIYYMSVAGITGERDKLPEDLPKNVAHLKELSGIPVLVGFGIKTPEQVRQVCCAADGAIVGSAFVRRIDQAKAEGGDIEQIIESVEAYAKELLTGLV
jgi:tryptophan synthase alpha chain